MGARTDLAIESLDFAQETLPAGIKQHNEEVGDITITTVEISDDASGEQLGKPAGTYITIEPTNFKTVPMSFEEEVETIANKLTELIPKDIKSALVVGLGNSDITPDALGPSVIKYIFATRHISSEISKAAGLGELFSVSAIAPGVLGQTGIETAEVIQSLCKETKPGLVIVIDALASKSIDRLGATIQISNTGISPGSGVLNKRKELSSSTLGTTVISMGVPMVVDLQSIAEDYTGKPVGRSDRASNMMVTPREIDVIIEHAAKTIAYAINKALQPSLGVPDIAALVS